MFLLLTAALPYAAPASGMSDGTKAALIGVLGVIASALIGWASARYAAKRSAQASKEQAKVTERQVDVTEWQAIVTALQGETGRLGKRVEDLEAKDTAKNDRIEELERKERDNERKYRAAIRYIGVLIAWRATTDGSNPPTAPVEIVGDLQQ